MVKEVLALNSTGLCSAMLPRQGQAAGLITQRLLSMVQRLKKQHFKWPRHSIPKFAHLSWQFIGKYLILLT
jgi:hypothetical protein